MGKLTDLLERAKGLLGAKPEKLRDQTDAVKHDRFDAELFRELMDEAPALRDLVEDLNLKHDYAEDLVRDTLMQFWQGDPQLRSRDQMRESHLVNHGVAHDVSQSDQLRQARSYTQHDRYGAAMATIGVTQEVKEYAKKHGDALREAQEEAEKAKEEQQKRQEELQQVMAGLPGMGGGSQPDADGEPGEDGADGEPYWAQDGFHGPLSPEQEQAALTLEQAIAAAEAAAQAQQEATGDLEAKAEQAAKAMRKPVNESITETAEKLEEEQQLFSAWGIEDGVVKAMPFEERQALAASLRGSKIHEFLDLVGRFKLMAAAQRVKKVEYGRDQVVGTDLSGDLSRVVMSEFAALAMGDDDLAELMELDFYRRWQEEQLLSRKFVGEERVGKGAIICVWDESGSMNSGSPTREAWAKALALALLDTARHQKRDFVGIGFSSHRQQVKYEFPKGKADVKDVLGMIEHFFGGGTDFMAPMTMATDVLEREYNDAGRAKGDIIFITDDDCHVTPDWLKEFQKRKRTLDFRVFGITVGSTRTGSALDALSDNVRSITEFADTEGQVRDIFQVI